MQNKLIFTLYKEIVSILLIFLPVCINFIFLSVFIFTNPISSFFILNNNIPLIYFIIFQLNKIIKKKPYCFISSWYNLISRIKKYNITISSNNFNTKHYCLKMLINTQSCQSKRPPFKPITQGNFIYFKPLSFPIIFEPFEL